MKKFVSAVLFAAIIVSSFTLSACNDDKSPQNSLNENSLQISELSSTESSEESVEPSKAAVTASEIAQMNSVLSHYQKVPEFNCKSASVNAYSISENKKITLIPDNLNLSYTDLTADTFKSAAKSAGFETVINSQTDGTASSVNDALNAAVNDNTDIVVMFGDINKDTVSSNIEFVQANGIPVLSAGCAGVQQNDHYVDNTVPINYQLVGKMLADWTIVKKEGKVNALAVNCTDSVLSNTVASGFKNEFDTYITDVTGYCTGINATSIEAGNGLATKIKQALQSDPNINYIVVFDDSMINDAVSAVDQLNSKVPVISTGGSTEAFDSAQNGNIEMLVAQSYEWTAYAMVDYALRVLSGSDLPKEQDVPFRIVTADSIATSVDEYSGSFDGFYEICFGSAFVPGYSGLWELY